MKAALTPDRGKTMKKIFYSLLIMSVALAAVSFVHAEDGYRLWLKYDLIMDYARANASIGINGAVPNIVNAEPEFITHEYLVKVAALADVFRPYGIKMFLSANFDSPKLLAGLKTSNPHDPQVKHGPLDFQPREPFSPLFGAMPNTPLVMELDPGQGAFGEDIDLNYLAPMWEECFRVVNFMDPLGLTMLRGWGDYCGPWVDNSEHATWNSPYYHRADSMGIGFDRIETESNAVEQYYPPVARKFASLETCPEEYLLWFHHLPWTYKMKSGNTLWDELCYHYYKGVEGVREIQNVWDSLQDKIGDEQFKSVKMLLKIQYENAIKWTDGSVLYFQTFSRLPIPEELGQPERSLEYYMTHNPR
jgi:alpha-glucuronidase